jgi:hypothetical protein
MVDFLLYIRNEKPNAFLKMANEVGKVLFIFQTREKILQTNNMV